MQYIFGTIRNGIDSNHLVDTLAMLSQTTASTESLPTLLTHVRTTSLVKHETMALPVTRLRKSSIAEVTFVRASVLVYRLDVFAQLVLLGKA